MKMIFKCYAKKLFGAKYGRVLRNLFVIFILYWGLHLAEIKIIIAPSILYFMIGFLTAGVMWQVLAAEAGAAQMQNMMMLPLDEKKFVLAYTAALGLYTIFSRTAVLLAVILAVSEQEWQEIIHTIFCMINAVLVTAVIFSLKKYHAAGILCVAGIAAVIFLGWNKNWFIGMLLMIGVTALSLLQNTDAYSFYGPEGEKKRTPKTHRHGSVWCYFLRYLKDHKNYLANTGIMWCAACILPMIFRQMESMFAVLIGFAVLTLNTPICILLSCDRSLEQAVRVLPGQKQMFCSPYCLFIFSCNVTADMIFLCSWQIQAGGVTVWMFITAVCFSLQSAICAVLLEWFYPIRKWKTESDLWHHPRKYVVPGFMVLLAGFIGTIPEATILFLILLGIEMISFVIVCQKA
ncbi:MAG TPA: hypothetical protein H9754_09695 [Candidatus Anaerostipes avistercoris]|uniref:Uncharacterized protein n=1 Tax=Candidatus Anaerostipes avistercoris TaxID=2838462 RepID=A0A9D2PHK1_9FIRM|nr:hypothetical protein [Candidatus Anaerostipes avistercoris]